MNNKIIIVPILALVTMTMSCGDDSASNSSSAASAIPAMAVTSPTASRSSSASLHLKKSFWAKVRVNLLKVLNPSSVAEETTQPTDVKPMDQMVSDLKNDIQGSDPAALAAKIGNMTATSYRAPCYGPAWVDNATGVSVNRPTGDLGMVYDTASNTDLMACSASQLNALIGSAPQFLNKLIKLQATMIAAMNKADKDLPPAGEKVDAKPDMPTIPGITITTAEVNRLADRADGKAVYKSIIAFTDPVSKTGSVTVWHTPLNGDNTNFTGLIQAIVPHTPSMGDPNAAAYRGMSMVYEQVDGVIKYALDMAANRTTSSQDFFSTTTGRVDFSKASFGEDGNRIIAQFNENTNAVTMHYAWQAGEQDNSARAFAVEIAAGTKGSQTGVAYYGFGADIATLTDNVSTPWMTKMHCNWLNNLASGPSVAKIQSQTFQQDTNGAFVPVNSKLDFAPTDTCVKADAFTISNAMPTFFNGSRTISAHELVSVGDLGSVSAVTAPTYALP
ncbi:MAG: hypothetical protein AABZ06_10345 [Bdellovibrionota bacterium]